MDKTAVAPEMENATKEDEVPAEDPKTANTPQAEAKTAEEKKEDGKNHNRQQNQNGGSKKRKREGTDHYSKAYENTHYESILPNPQELHIPGVPNVIHTTTPGTPLRQFKYSLEATLTEVAPKNNQIIHQHANGLCVVTAGCLSEEEEVEQIEFVAPKVADKESTNERRKKQAKMLKKGKLNNNNSNANSNSGLVSPTTEIARIHFKNGHVMSLYACVWGTLLELNATLTPQQLIRDPLLDGYLAVILPTGPFPPRARNREKGETAMVEKDREEEATEADFGSGLAR